MLMAESFHLLHDQSHEGKIYDCKHPALDDSAWSSRGLCPVIPAHGLTYHEFKVIPTLIDFFCSPKPRVFAGNKDGGSTAVRFPARRRR